MDGDPRVIVVGSAHEIRVDRVREAARRRSNRFLALSRERERARARASVLRVCVCTCWCVRDVRIRHGDGDEDDDEDEDENEDDEARIVPGRGARSARRGRRVEDGHGRLIMPAGSAARKKSCRCCSSSRSSSLVAVFSSA